MLDVFTGAEGSLSAADRSEVSNFGKIAYETRKVPPAPCEKKAAKSFGA